MLDRSRKKALLDGWFADGYKKPNGAQCVTTVSERLALDMAQIARDVYLCPVSISRKMCNRVCVIEGREVNERPQYCVTISNCEKYGFYEDGFVWCNIKSIRREKESNEVFNLSVNEEHSYNVYGIAVHNCQPFSCAGSRKGAEDDRYLWPEVLRGVDEIRPNWFIGENVAGITSMVLPGDEIKVESYTDLEGESYLETEMRQQFIVDRICNDLESIGYSVQPIIIPACAVGAPHRRDRIWFIANCSNARPEGMQQGENGIYEFEVTADTTSTRFQERFILDRREDEKETGTRVDDELKRYGKERIVTNTDKELLEGRDAQRPQRRENQEFTIKSFNCSSCWENFPSQSPVCCGDDGLPSQLSGITFSKHRAESIKAYGNSMVPQLVYQIFKAIGEVENLLKLNQNKKT